MLLRRSLLVPNFRKENYPLGHALLLLEHSEEHDSVADFDMTSYNLDISSLRPATLGYVSGEESVVEGMSWRGAEMFR